MLKSAILLFSFMAISQVSSQASCGLKGIPINTSPEQPYVLPSIPANLEPFIATWEIEYEGPVARTTVNVSSDYEYLIASLEQVTRTYLIQSSTKTSQFVSNTGRGLITRWINMYCLDNTMERYHFITPVSDITPCPAHNLN